MTDAEALIAAICAEPKEDAPRLAYADYLDEHAEEVECGACKGTGSTNHQSADASWIRSFGYTLGCAACNHTGRIHNNNAARAEFIRVQVEIATWRPCDNIPDHRHPARCAECERRTTLRRRERELLSNHWLMEQLLPELPGLDGMANIRDMSTGETHHAGWNGGNGVWIEADFSRGFVSAITCDWQSWRTHAAAIRKVQPIEKVRLTDRPEMISGIRARQLIPDGIELPPTDGRGVIRWEAVLPLIYPGITFELPAEEVTLQAHRMHGAIPVSQEWQDDIGTREIIRRAEEAAMRRSAEEMLRRAPFFFDPPS